MAANDIKNLLEMFYNGETSLEEEQILTGYLLQENVPDEFLPDKKLFSALNENPVEIPHDSGKAIESLIDSFREETSGSKIKKLHVRYWAIGIAASIALIFGVSQFHKSRQADSVFFTDTYKNPDEAYRAAMEALQLFSENFSMGTESVEKANNHLEKAQEIIYHSTK